LELSSVGLGPPDPSRLPYLQAIASSASGASEIILTDDRHGQQRLALRGTEPLEAEQIRENAEHDVR
jgi:hypothetical protein